jgi:uncharacterized damage-inducible protein DinB
MMDDPRVPLLLHQLALAYDQRSWHGPNLRGSLRGLSLDAASYRPQPERHNVWELVVHCAYWKYRVYRLLSPASAPSFQLKGSNWFRRPADPTETAWKQDLALLDLWHKQLRAAASTLEPENLERQAGNSEFTLLELVSGAAAHDLYHAGQIRLLRRMHGNAPPQAEID